MRLPVLVIHVLNCRQGRRLAAEERLVMVNGVNDTRPDDLDALVGRVLIDVRRNVVLIPWWLRAVSEHRISPWLVAPHSGWRL